MYEIKRKQKKSRGQFTWTTERIWADVIDTGRHWHNRCITAKSLRKEKAPAFHKESTIGFLKHRSTL